MGSSYQFERVLPELTRLARETGTNWTPTAPEVFGFRVGDVLFWKSWGHPHEVRPGYWEHGGVVLLVLEAHPDDPKWIEVQGFNLEPPHTQCGSWRWGAYQIEPRLASGKLALVSSLCVHRSVS